MYLCILPCSFYSHFVYLLTYHWLIEYSLFGVYLFTVCVFIYCFFHVLVSYLLIYRFRHFFAMLYLVLFFSWNRSIHWFCFFKRLYVGEKNHSDSSHAISDGENKQTIQKLQTWWVVVCFRVDALSACSVFNQNKLFQPNPPLFCVSVNHENFHGPRQNWIFLRSVILFLRVRQ